jgi:8-oxo-dGTP diphosphatase
MMSRLVALAVVKDMSGHVLLVRSARRPNRWELPGGEVEKNESPVAAVCREVDEETGIQIEAPELVGIYFGVQDHILRILFRATELSSRESRKPGRGEILDCRWWPSDKLPTPMPVLVHRMLDDAQHALPAICREVTDDTELI